MKKLKKQTSRFFSEAPSADERAAGGAGVFDAGIGAPPPAMKKKKSFWSLKRGESEDVTPSVPAIPEQSCEDERPVTAVRDGGQGEKTAGEGKKRGMLGLRGKSSRVFRPTLPPPSPASEILLHTRTASISTSTSDRSPSTINSGPPTPRIAYPKISGPLPLHPAYRAPAPANLATTPFTRPPSYPPLRPARPTPLDKDIIRFMNDESASIVQSARNSLSTTEGSKSSSESEAELSDEERQRRFKRKEYRNDIPLPRVEGYGQYSHYISPLYDPAVFAIRTSKKIDPRTGKPKKIVPRAPYPFTSPQDLPLMRTLWDHGITSRVERQEDGYFAFIQEELYPPGPFERWDPAMGERWVCEERRQLVNIASDSEKDGKREGKGEATEKDLEREERRLERREKRQRKRQKKMPFGSFVLDTVGGGRRFVRDI